MKALAAHVLGVSALGLLLVSCGDDCLGISCPLGVAIRITVSSVAVAGPVENVSIQVSDANLPPTTCTVEANATVCRVFANSGTYALVVGAPGFQSTQRDVTVRGTIGQCDCPIVTTENVSVSLSRTP